MNWYNSLKVSLAGRFTEHYLNASFKKEFAKLPNEIKQLARQRFNDMVKNRASVNLKKLPENGSGDVWSASIKEGKPSYRALAMRVGNNFIWYWIGSHETYNDKKSKPVPSVQLAPAALQGINSGLPKQPFQQKGQQPAGAPMQAKPPQQMPKKK